jgi:hypothetical protein
MTIIYNKREEILIVTFWLVWCMDLPHVNLHVCLNKSCYVRRSILAIGLVRFGGPSCKLKEVNVVYTPRFCALKENWQKFVIKVGESKSCVMLHANVTYWSTNKDGKNLHNDLVEHQLDK